MNFIRPQLSIGRVLGQRCRQVTETWNNRGMCSNLPGAKPQSSPAATPTPAQHPGFRVPGCRPSDMDKKMMVWSGRFKSVDQIPETVSFEMIDAARNKIRVKAAYLMMALTIGACVVMVIMGKRAAGRHESLIQYNMEKKAKWREQIQNESNNAAVLPEKAQ
ncbi:protein FAM162B [Parambassis ranga]|uniref:Protein FAM162B n=1 Tax=Parambassis ranga TaxID=210632 RepID=A0A6P7KFE9_9TELE|nr:protein FAM162B-like [Parambassis ranga]